MAPCDSPALETAIESAAADLEAAGRKPYIIPVGGSTAIGALGYVAAGREIREQLPDVDFVVAACGSGGTVAGLSAALGSHTRVLAVRVDGRPDLAARVDAVADAAAALAGTPGPGGRCVLDDRQLGDGYGAPTAAGLAAIQVALRAGLVLDHVYTAKSFAGLIHARRSGRIERDTITVFLHTGGMAGLLAGTPSHKVVHEAAV
jgi:1-aminocyclopropane-1-carboxylate deaminase/D-cysteine desulfhydrase-like pyridoxal-dependent ACC family enzyme